MRHHHILMQVVKKKKEVSGISWWQLSLLGIGSIMGAGFFLGAGLSIQATGPSVLFSFLIAGFIAYVTFIALSEMTLNNPSLDSYRSFVEKAFGRRWGYVSGWVYWIAGIFIISSELTALALFTQLWLPDIPALVLIAFYAAIGIGINLLGVKDFSTIESFFAVIKIAVVIGFVIFGSLMILNPMQKNMLSHLSFQSMDHSHWFTHGLKGFWSSMIYALFPFGGILVVSIASKELEDKKSIIKTGRLLIGLLVSLYIFSIMVILKLTPLNSISGQESPFITALKAFEIPYIDSLFNMVIITASFSTMVGAIFSITRVVVALAKDGYAPRSVSKLYKNKINLNALGLCSLVLVLVIGLSYVLPSSLYASITASAGILLVANWVIMLLSQLKLRKLAKDNGTVLNYKMKFTPYITYVAVGLILLSLLGGVFNHDQLIGLMVSLAIIGFIYISYFVLNIGCNKG